MTNSPVNRYKRHFYWQDCKTYNFIRYQAVVNKSFVRMKVVYCSPDIVDVAKMEAKAICAIFKAGFSILNSLTPYLYNSEYPHAYKNVEPLPIYPSIDRLPHKIFTKDIIQPIIDSQKQILNEYGYKEHRHYNMDHSKSISRPIRDKRAKCS